MTLFSDESTISEEVSIDYDENKVSTYAIKSSDDYVYKTCHDYDYPFYEYYSFNVETIYSIRIPMILPLFWMRRILLMCRVVNFLCCR